MGAYPNPISEFLYGYIKWPFIFSNALYEKEEYMQKIGEVTVYKDIKEFEGSITNNIIAIFLGKGSIRNNWEWADAKELKV